MQWQNGSASGINRNAHVISPGESMMDILYSATVKTAT